MKRHIKKHCSFIVLDCFVPRNDARLRVIATRRKYDCVEGSVYNKDSYSWILDVALPVGSALKDDGKVGECILEGKPRKVDCRVTLFLAMTLAERVHL